MPELLPAIMSPVEAEAVRHRKNGPSDHPEGEDLTDELMEWARATRAAYPETMPGVVETAAPINAKQQPKILVVALDESAARRVRVHLFDDTQAASRFIETLLEIGLNPDRIIVFQATPIHTTYRLVVTIGEPEQPPTVST
jgi:hypothetical protein